MAVSTAPGRDRAVETARKSDKTCRRRWKFKFPSPQRCSAREAESRTSFDKKRFQLLARWRLKSILLASHVDSKADRQKYTRFFNLSYRFNFVKLFNLQPSMVQ
ncbi:hypothetical protein QUB13_13165 [Microcoleus sp. B4-D4]